MLAGSAVAVAVARLVVDLLVAGSWTLLPASLLPLDYLASRSLWWWVRRFSDGPPVRHG